MPDSTLTRPSDHQPFALGIKVRVADGRWRIGLKSNDKSGLRRGSVPGSAVVRGIPAVSPARFLEVLTTGRW